MGARQRRAYGLEMFCTHAPQLPAVGPPAPPEACRWQGPHARGAHTEGGPTASERGVLPRLFP
ncbi:MAG: hypothetical protein ISS57_14620 [Anaerolineales bacterium]|nr:hypothetical protein [Anaerolineales bacterium]